VPLEFTDALMVAGYGLLDNAIDEFEERERDATRKKTIALIKDVERIGLAIGSTLFNLFLATPGTFADRVSFDIALASTPLAFHSIRRRLKEAGVMKYEGAWVVERPPAVVEQPAPVVAPSAPIPRITSY
jgi:archaellum biogenesis protein FlaJ (TadC family)